MKKILVLITMLFTIPIIVNASSNTAAKIGNKYFDTLSDAIANAGSKDIIKLLTNINLEQTLNINKTINIDLNENEISAPSSIFLVQGGTLNISGIGTIKETEPNYGAIKVIGSSTYTDENYSTLNIKKDVTLEGWSGIFITHDSSKSYGVNITLDGKINAVSDINGDHGVGIYVNGNIKDEKGAPKINLLNNARIYSNGTGLYIAGYTTLNINKSYIEGIDSGIAIKSGTLNIDGATIVCNGEDETPTEGYNNGVKASGTTLQIESNNGYAGNIELNISNGTFKSKNSNVIYEYIGLSISGGEFISEVSKNVFLLSNSLKETHKSFISGGQYTSNPKDYLKTGYSIKLDNNKYKVINSNTNSVFSQVQNNQNDKNIGLLFFLISTFLLIIIYFNRLKILKYIKKHF